MGLGVWTNKIGKELLDLVYPPGLYCICCGKITDPSRTYGLCNDCMRDIKWITDQSCKKCGKPLGVNNPGPICFHCRSNDHVFDRGYACCEYGVHEKTMLYEFKYASRAEIGNVIGEIIYDRMHAEFPSDELRQLYDAAIPVPIFRQRKQKRGFNQSEIIAGRFSELSGIECKTDILLRNRQTRAMKGLDPAERMSNIHGAFEIRARKLELIPNKRFLLIDDIYTTGATLDEAASVLKAAGASRVDFVVFASGADMIYS